MAAHGYPRHAAQGRRHHRPAGATPTTAMVFHAGTAPCRRHAGDQRRPRAVRHRARRLGQDRTAARLRRAGADPLRRRAVPQRHRPPRDQATMSVDATVTERPIQLHGSRLARGLLRLAGWRVHFDGLPARQGVLIVYPHTSNWDFVVGVLAKWAIGIPLAFWGKDTLFDAAAVRPLDALDRRRAGRSPQPARRRSARWSSRFAAARERDDVPLAGARRPKARAATATAGAAASTRWRCRPACRSALAFFDYPQRRVGVDSLRPPERRCRARHGGDRGPARPALRPQTRTRGAGAAVAPMRSR